MILALTDRVILAAAERMISIIIQPEQLITLSQHDVFDRSSHVLLRPQIDSAAMPGPGLCVQTDQSSMAQRASCIGFESVKHRFGAAHRAHHTVHMVRTNVKCMKHILRLTT